MLKKLILIPFVSLAACGETGQQLCAHFVKSDIELLESGIERAELNVQRGFATGRNVTPGSAEMTLGYSGRSRCVREGLGGSIERYSCSYTVDSNSTQRIPVDMNEERKILTELRQKLVDDRSTLDARVADCLSR